MAETNDTSTSNDSLLKMNDMSDSSAVSTALKDVVPPSSIVDVDAPAAAVSDHDTDDANGVFLCTDQPNDDVERDPNRDASTTGTIPEAFDVTVTYLRENHEIGALLQKHLSTEQQLQLYGLYKQSTCTTTEQNDTESSSSSSSWWSVRRIREETKRRAWDSYRHLTPLQARQCYVQTVLEWTSQYPDTMQSHHAFLVSVTTATNTIPPKTGSIQNHSNHNIFTEPNGVPLLNHPIVTDTGIGTSALEVMGRQKVDPTLLLPPPTNSAIHLTSNQNNDGKTNSDESLLTTFILSDVLGISPLQPRGTLDIDYADLHFAFRQCIWWSTSWSLSLSKQDNLYRIYEEEIRQRWIQALLHPLPQPSLSSNTPIHVGPPGAVDVMVGLSVRSLLDLYLQVQQYPPHSEIIISPPITVPGMIAVLQHHQIHCVGVDVPSSSPDDNDDVVVTIDLEGIQKAITPNTVAVMIVHVFGMIVASNNEMQQLRSIINKSTSSRHIDILEDCAECFTGLHPDGAYLGSPHADVSFFSFGRIKNRTAIHGGIVIVRDTTTTCHEKNETKMHRHRPANLITSMNRLQHSYSRDQSNVTFLQQVCKCFLLKWISGSPLLYGLIYTIVTGIGLNFDTVVTSLLRGFPMDRIQMMYRIRQRPSLAMLALLRRRLFQPPSSSIKQRIKYCRTFTEQIIQERRNSMYQIGMMAPSEDCDNCYWLYPILVKDRVAIAKHLRQCGFDATSGMSQLCCVESPTNCPKANTIMSSILYLPIDACMHRIPKRYNTNNGDDNKLIRSLMSAMQNTSNSGTVSDASTGRTRQRQTILRTIATCVLVICFWSFLVSATISFLQLLTILITIYTTLIWLLRIQMGTFYVESSKGFAKYNYLLNNTSENDHTTNHSSDDKPRTTGLLAQIETLQLPLTLSEETLQLPLTLSETKKRSVLLTGATGFVGSMLLRDLLFHRKELHLESVILLCRSKKGKTAAERVELLLDDGMFSFLSNTEKQTLVKIIVGDIILPRAGLSDEMITHLVQETRVTHIFNCAASVSFTQSLPDAATANILSSLNLQCLGASISKGRVQFVHISTAFVHGGCSGSNGEPLNERLFSLGQFDPIKIYSSMTGTQFYASKAMIELSFPNTYTFSKCVAEHLLLTNDPSIIIIRPSIIGPAVEFPHEGWAGKTPSTIVAAACLYLSYQWNIWSFGCHVVPIIPVDVVSRFVIGKAFCASQLENHKMCAVDESSGDESYEKISYCSSNRSTSSTASSDRECGYQIYNAAWDVRSPRSSGFTWFEYAGAVTQVGCIKGYFSRPTAYLGLLFATKLIPKMKLTAHRFATIHDWCVKLPFDWIIQCRKKFGLSTSQMKRLYTYLNLPLLFYPFMNNSYHFHSELIAPSEVNGEHYLMICVSAAHNFIQRSRQNQIQVHQHTKHTSRKQSKHLSLLGITELNGSVRGPSLFWAISQPHGNMLVRITAWLLLQILKRCYTEISVDVQSFSPALLAQKETGLSCTILAPTHRSIFDSLILTLICFSVPELQIRMPSIAAADLFERLPVFGWLLHFLGAFFIRRGRMSLDPNLMQNVSSVKAKSFHSVLELFIEGTRSRDRRFVQPKTGVLRCLHDSCYHQTIVPIVINYERIAEQESLVAEASGGVPSALHLSGMISWLIDVLRGHVKLGRVHVVACDPIAFDDAIGPRINDVAHDIQRRQAKNIFVSEYHVIAASRVLSVKPDVVRRAFEAVGAKSFPNCRSTTPLLNVSSNTSENLSILFQISPLLAPLFASARPKWSNWLWVNDRGGVTACEVDALTNPCVREVMQTLLSLFDKADQCVDAAVKSLIDVGFVQPKSSHILQTALRDTDSVSALLLQASIDIRFRGDRAMSNNKKQGLSTSLVRRPKVGTGEALGYWGFYGSQFVLQVDTDGRTYVRMDGDHYSLRGKKISGLLSFMEAETAISVDPFNEAFAESSDDITLIPSKIQDTALASLKLSVPNISQKIEDRIRHGTGHSQEDVFLIRSKETFRVPDLVVRPASASEVESLINLAKLHKWCVIPFGGGTNVSNALRCPSYETEPRPIVSLDMRDMRQILWIDEENGIAHVEAGITGRQLEQDLAIRGYTMGHEPDSIEFSTLGGWIATKASGMKRNKYGNIEDIVKSVNVIGSDGLLKHGTGNQRHVWGRESCGLDLRNLMLGSEGCMGVITSASIRICRTAESKDYDSILFFDFQTGLRFLRDVARLGSDCPASVRLLDNDHFRLGHALRPDSNSMVASFTNYCFGAFVKWKANFDTKTMVCVTLMYESNTAEVKRQKRAVNRISERYGGVRLGSAAGRASYDLTFMIAYIRDFALSYYFIGESFETFAPWSQIETIITETKATIRQEHEKRSLPGKPFIGCRVTQLYHEGACLYFYFCMNFAGVPNASSVYSEIEHQARAAILANGGSLSHHHGIGKLRSSFLPSIDSEPLRGVVQKLKQAIDPDNIFGARNGGYNS